MPDWDTALWTETSETELYKVKEVHKKFKWVDTQLKFKIPLFLHLVREERGEL